MRFVTHATCIAIGLAIAGPLQAAELRMVSSFPENFVFTEEIAKPFMEAVSEATGGEVELSLTGPDAVPPLEQFEPVQAGVFDVLFTHPAYHAGATSLGLAIDAIAPDPAARRDAGIIAALDTHYADLGFKLIAAPPTGSEGFQYVLKEPIDSEPAFDGRKIRGTVSYHPMIDALGGSPVVMGGGEVYSALQTGVVDGAAWGLTGVKDFKWNEVAGYLTRPVFGQVGVMVLMNRDVWDGLTDDQRAAIEDAAVALETASVARFDELAAVEFEALKELGMKETAFSEAEATELEALWADGVWSIAEGKMGEEATALRELARGAGLSK
ncbi:MAG: TRAP transporter substrate-binding protein DctP [Pseudomonadota bacterium]